MMQSFLVIAALAASAATLVSRADLTINTPTSNMSFDSVHSFRSIITQLSLNVVTLHLIGLVELPHILLCQHPSFLGDCSASLDCFFLSVFPSLEYANGTVDSTVSAGAAKSLEIQIQAAPGTAIKFGVEDSAGSTATTAVVTVGTGSDSCLPGSGTTTGSSDIAELAVICTDINYGGNCIEFVSPPFDSAHPLGCAPLKAPYAGNISSAHGVTDGYTCFLYPQLGCLGTRLVISGQIPDFRAASVNFNDKALSWSCGSALTSV
ncbi:hypothetical protein MVEN_01991000 [Mycena venus]|uniref:Uncharacterized protein n=1 Tax=Mycena venus TaxID=2733690 RepID=A0A8H6XEN2_9AGAR|nr:hypothetical protein MVEN_01991000 [Mycena venus]